jgi:hypothetical protein
MKTIKLLGLSLLMSANLAFAEAPTDATIEELMTITKAEKMVTDMQDQVKAMMDQGMANMTKDQKPTEAEQKALDTMVTKMTAAVKEEVSWDKLKPVSIKLYKETFSEEELKGIVDFYKTPAGEALVNKMPTLMQKTMEATQGMMGGLQPKLQQIQTEFIEEMGKIKASEKPAEASKEEPKAEEKK